MLDSLGLFQHFQTQRLFVFFHLNTECGNEMFGMTGSLNLSLVPYHESSETTRDARRMLIIVEFYTAIH